MNGSGGARPDLREQALLRAAGKAILDPLREPHTSREQLILSKDRPKALPSAHAYVLFFFPKNGAKVYQHGLQIFTYLRQVRGIMHRCTHGEHCYMDTTHTQLGLAALQIKLAGAGFLS